jgi:hypothetical protein
MMPDGFTSRYAAYMEPLNEVPARTTEISRLDLTIPSSRMNFEQSLEKRAQPYSFYIPHTSVISVGVPCGLITGINVSTALPQMLLINTPQSPIFPPPY